MTALVGTQRDLLDKKLQTVHQLLQDHKPEKGVEAPESGKELGVKSGEGKIKS